MFGDSYMVFEKLLYQPGALIAAKPARRVSGAASGADHLPTVHNNG